MKTLLIMFLASICSICFPPNSFAQANLSLIKDSVFVSGDPDDVLVSLTITNKGDTASVPTYIGFYVATNEAIYPSDSSLIWVQPLPGIAAGDTIVADTSINLCDPFLIQQFPYVFQYGQPFNLACIIDDGDLVSETNEGDNLFIFPNQLSLLCTVGIDAVKVSSLQISPNPGDGKIFISLPENAYGEILYVRNTSGQVLQTSPAIDGDIDLSFLPSGVYFIDLKAGDVLYREKLIIQH